MTDLVYTQFGYGKVEPASLHKAADDGVKLEAAPVPPKKTSKADGLEEKPEITHESATDKIIKVAFKWGGTGYLPVVSWFTEGKLCQEEDQTQSQDFLWPKKGL